MSFFQKLRERFRRKHKEPTHKELVKRENEIPYFHFGLYRPCEICGHYAFVADFEKVCKRCIRHGMLLAAREAHKEKKRLGEA